MPGFLVHLSINTGFHAICLVATKFFLRRDIATHVHIEDVERYLSSLFQAYYFQTDSQHHFGVERFVNAIPAIISRIPHKPTGIRKSLRRLFRIR